MVRVISVECGVLANGEGRVTLHLDCGHVVERSPDHPDFAAAEEHLEAAKRSHGPDGVAFDHKLSAECEHCVRGDVPRGSGLPRGRMTIRSFNGKSLG